jgi:glycine cleavage system transcriptional repressor
MTDRAYLVLSATEPDRTGLMAEITGFIAGRGCNVEDSRLVVLGGYAGIMLLVSGEPAEVQAVIDGLEELRGRTGIRAVPRRVAARRADAAPGLPRIAVAARAIDHEGIIHALADTVRRNDGNILELEANTESAPMSGEPLFALHMTVRVPDGGDGGERLRRELESVAREQGIELEISLEDPQAGAPVLHGPERRSGARKRG